MRYPTKADNGEANAINKLPQLSLNLISDSTTTDLYRSIRNHLPSLIPGLLPEDISSMSLGLSHSLSRHKLKFSPDKIDTMIVQAISLLDDLDKELNTYAMRVKEWYGWHFPEMARIINDNLAYSRVILKMGMRTSAAQADLAEILPEEIEVAVKSAAEISMGTEITNEDLENVQALAEQVVSFTEYRAQLSNYLSARMTAIAPNLTALVGDLVGARLIAHAGSLMNLAKSPASTIQILGAEKALFRALKTKHDTPKYGLIYHASLVGQATGKNKGKIARMLATKAALGLRVDTLTDWSAEGEGTEEERSALGVENRLKIERRLASLEGKPIRSKGVSIGPNGASGTFGKWEIKEARKYNPDADGLAGDEPAAATPNPQKSKKSLSSDIKMIEEVDEVEEANSSNQSITVEGGSKDDEMEDVDDEEASEVIDNEQSGQSKGGKNDNDEQSDSSEGEENSRKASTPQPRPSRSSNPIATATANNESTSNVGPGAEDKSETISTVSADTPNSPNSPAQKETNWQSSILGNTEVAKKARKKERHERKVALSEERSRMKELRNAKQKRRLDRKERRQKRAEQIERRAKGNDEQYRELATQAGLSITRYKRKLERGEIKFEADGKPISISKKDIKKARKAAERAEMKAHGDATSSKKRKRDEEVAEKSDKLEQQKSKKSKV